MEKELRAVLAQHPTLTPNGLNAPCDSSLLEPHNVLEFELAVSWLRSVPRAKLHPERSQSSYRLKHWAEDWIGSYVCNGAMCAAAWHLGYPVKEFPGSPNVLIGVGGMHTWPIRPGSQKHRDASNWCRRKPTNVMFPPPELMGAYIKAGYELPTWAHQFAKLFQV
jgi:hypothetical protein